MATARKYFYFNKIDFLRKTVVCQNLKKLKLGFCLVWFGLGFLFFLPHSEESFHENVVRRGFSNEELSHNSMLRSLQ